MISRKAWSTSWLATGRFCSARSKLVRSLRSSNISRRSPLLTIAGSFSSAVSNVLKRSPHFGHSRRRRTVAPSSVSRESMTRVSSCWQKGQCIRRRSAVHRELLALRLDFRAHLGDHRLVARGIEHVAQPVGQVHAIGVLVAAGGGGRG